MKKLGFVLGMATVAVISGCRDPEFGGGASGPDNEVKPIAPTPVQNDFGNGPAAVSSTPAATTSATPVIATPVPVTPVETTPVVTTPVTTQPAAVTTQPVSTPSVAATTTLAATTTYVVLRGDTLSKISKKYNVKIDAIKKANGLTGDTIRIGQKLTLPVKSAVVDASANAPVASVQAVKVAGPFAGATKAAGPYAGATKAYVVKGGDTLGAIALANGITVRQLKEMNGLSKDLIRVGQTLKIPAEKVAKPVVAAAVPKVESVVAPKAKPVVAAATPKVEPVAAPKVEPVAAAKVEPEVEPLVADAKDDGEVELNPEDAKSATQNYTVQEGDDITSVSIAYGVSAAVIRNLNNLGENDQLKVGQVIKMPAEQQ